MTRFRLMVKACGMAPAVLGAMVWFAAPGAHAQPLNPYIIGMMAGPVSDGPSVLLLKKREDQFLSIDTLAIACGAGGLSGLFAHALPAMALAATGAGAPIAVGVLAGTSVFGCLIGTGGGAAAMATQWTLNKWHGLPAPAPAPVAVE